MVLLIFNSPTWFFVDGEESTLVYIVTKLKWTITLKGFSDYFLNPTVQNIDFTLHFFGLDLSLLIYTFKTTFYLSRLRSHLVKPHIVMFLKILYFVLNVILHLKTVPNITLSKHLKIVKLLWTLSPTGRRCCCYVTATCPVWTANKQLYNEG